MYLSENIINDVRYPNWIRNHVVFRDIKYYSKIFDRIGLINSSVQLENTFAENVAVEFIEDLIKLDIFSLLKNDFYADVSKETVCGLRKFFLNLSRRDCLEIKKEKKVSIYLSENICSYSGDVIFKRGSKLFHLLTRLPSEIQHLVWNLESFKKFGRLNIPLGSAKICFSTDPWDIATMSMRGIQTCQNWNNKLSKSIIGSMVDSYVGIIYIHDNTQTNYGSKMLYRAMVWFGIYLKNGFSAPALFIGSVYPNHFPEIEKILENYLLSKTKLKVFFMEKMRKVDLTDPRKMFIPTNRSSDSLRFYSKNGRYEDDQCEDSIKPYMDFNVYRKHLGHVKHGNAYEINCRFKNILQQSSALFNVDVNILSFEKSCLLLSLKKRYNTCIIESMALFANLILEDMDEYKNIGDEYYIIKLYLTYLNKKSSVLEKISYREVARLNRSLGMYKTGLFTKKDFVLIMKNIMPAKEILAKLKS